MTDRFGSKANNQVTSKTTYANKKLTREICKSTKSCVNLQHAEEGQKPQKDKLEKIKDFKPRIAVYPEAARSTSGLFYSLYCTCKSKTHQRKIKNKHVNNRVCHRYSFFFWSLRDITWYFDFGSTSCHPWCLPPSILVLSSIWMMSAAVRWWRRPAGWESAAAWGSRQRAPF